MSLSRVREGDQIIKKNKICHPDES